MGLADRLKAGIEKPAAKCKVLEVAADLSQEDADALMELVFKRLDVSSPRASEVLREENLFISEDTIRRHRKNECRTCATED